MRNLKQTKAITLIALTITIIIMLILAAITISLTIREDGIIAKGEEAGEKTELAKQEEENELNKLYSSMMVATNDSSKITISMEDLNTLIENKVKEQMKENSNSSNPTGSVIAQMGNKAPAGYLSCDGTLYNISEYTTLAEYIKEEFGTYNYWGGDGETTFAVPDLRGEFLRGTGTATRATGTGVAVGAHQDATRVPYAYTGNVTIAITGYNNGVIQADKTTTKSVVSLSPSSTSAATAANRIVNYTTRPTNTSVLYCIKY